MSKDIQVTIKKSDQIFGVLSFSIKRKILSPTPKTLLYRLREGKIAAMGKGKNIRMELTGEELQIKIEKIMHEIQEVKEEE